MRNDCEIAGVQRRLFHAALYVMCSPTVYKYIIIETHSRVRGESECDFDEGAARHESLGHLFELFVCCERENRRSILLFTPASGTAPPPTPRAASPAAHAFNIKPFPLWTRLWLFWTLSLTHTHTTAEKISIRIFIERRGGSARKRGTTPLALKVHLSSRSVGARVWPRNATASQPTLYMPIL